MMVHNDIIRAIDAGNVSMLVILDLSATFDTVDHDAVIKILNLRFGVVDCALYWFRSYLSVILYCDWNIETSQSKL